MNFKKLSYNLNWFQYRFGQLLFPILELVFRWIDNHDSEAKKHFQQAQLSLEKRRINIAILNLNMVLTIKPSHFLSRVFRGKIYLREKRFKLAAADLLKAYKTNPYRFIHYGLYHDYDCCVNIGKTSQSSQKHGLDRALDFFNQQASKETKDFTETEFSSQLEFENQPTVLESLNYSQKELSKFSQMGPITQEEIKKTDWEKLSKTLISGTKGP
jgi:tetratricopeptide (TPR) repeat protein